MYSFSCPYGGAEINIKNVLAVAGKSCANKKVPFSQINISLLADFWPKEHYSANHKSGRFSVIPAGTRSVVIVGHFLMAPTVPPSFVDGGPNLINLY